MEVDIVTMIKDPKKCEPKSNKSRIEMEHQVHRDDNETNK